MGKWGISAILVVCFAFMFGCRTPQPNLKPDKEAEKFVTPPQDARYDSPAYPKEAFDRPVDPGKAALDAKNTPGMSQRGGSMMPTGGVGPR
jgi:hypothetical protein